jgi:predicted DCC family thiol-disulfide oxidoreductase YuxK
MLTLNVAQREIKALSREDEQTSGLVWYDGACPLCRHEIEFMRRLDRHNAIDFQDVTSWGRPNSRVTGRQITRRRETAERLEFSGWASAGKSAP